MVEVTFTKKAKEKYKLLNGTRKSVNECLDSLKNETIKIKDLKLLFSGDELNAYTMKCDSVYILIGQLIKNENKLFIVDFLTNTEYKHLSKD